MAAKPNTAQTPLRRDTKNFITRSRAAKEPLELICAARLNDDGDYFFVVIQDTCRFSKTFAAEHRRLLVRVSANSKSSVDM